MSLPNLKELKKLADACRKAGIKHYKSADMEFTLTDDLPIKSAKIAKANLTTEVDPVETDTLTEDQLLFYSVTDVQGNT